MSKPKPTGAPHVFDADPDLPPDQNGTRICRHCRLLGAPGDSHHAMPDPVPDVAGLAAGERSGR